MENEKQKNETFDDDQYKEEDFEQLVTVFKTEDQGIAGIAKSILDKAGITYSIKGDEMSDLYGLGVTGISGFITGIEPVEIQVLQGDAENAIGLLKDLEKSKQLDENS